ncbi:diguanylate cyclase [Rhodobacteraceae bacterium LMO-12]|nr:diguanylate cyclase [Rhodobacteraceae bacterium LMO-JJ12]
MPATILIIDPVATNRIVMKVKLARACYQVAQADSGNEGLETARQLRPDLILCADHLPDMTTETFARTLRTAPSSRSTPLIVEAMSHNSERRLQLLLSGADDILVKPHGERLLLARLRSLLRLRETAAELTLREGASRALGLAEATECYVTPGPTAIVAPRSDTAVKWSRKLSSHIPGKHHSYGYRDAILQMSEGAAPDVVAVILTPECAESGLQLLADLKAKPETRDCGVLVLADGEHAERYAADALDRGANDALTKGATVHEIALRLDRLTARKRTLERLRKDMRDGLRAALTDPLTGLFNRRYAMPNLAAIADAARSGGCTGDYAVMIIDVDHFKLINDRFGHSPGDTVLIRLAEILKQSVTEPNLLARVGGEEFLVVMPQTGRRTARIMAQRLCRQIRDTVFEMPGRLCPLQVTVSIGVAMGSDIGTPTDPTLSQHEAVLDGADKALYEAKAHGRNQVALSQVRSAA